MRLSLWGVRGSIATPGPSTVKYGGNTTCLYVETEDRKIILDAGTGIRALGLQLISTKKPVEVDIFITHSHSDHIQGFPFFLPLYDKDNTINVYGKLHYDKSVDQVMATQMEYSYFPLPLRELPSQPSFFDMDDQIVEFEKTTVRSLMMNHPVMMQSYRVECGGKSVAFSGDMEPYYDLMESVDTIEMAVGRNQAVIDFFKGVNVLVIDCSYTDEEYKVKQGWGHNCVTHAVWFGGEAKVKHLVLTHHEPTRDDAAVESMLEQAKNIQSVYGFEFESITMAYEGQVFDL